MAFRVRRRANVNAWRVGFKIIATLIGLWASGYALNIDFNSLYPYSCMQIRFPDLRQQNKIFQPLNVYGKMNILSEIGIHRAMLKNRSNDIGLLPIRTPDFSYIPKEGKYLIGTWTSDEILRAMSDGYDLMDIEWSITWEEAKENPYQEIIPELYKKRKSGNEFDNFFYKSVMNNHLGKLAQIRTQQELIIDNVERTKEYLQKGYEVIKGIRNTFDYIFKRDLQDAYQKSYYAPIIPILVNAKARCIMYDNYKKIGKDNLIYTDTDSIMFTGNNLERIDIGVNIGQFKLEYSNVPSVVWGRKTYSIGEDIKASGISKKDLNVKDFEKGYIETQRVIGLNDTDDMTKVGKFKKDTRDLNEQRELFKQTMKAMQDNEIFIDYTIEDINYFKDKISEIK